MPELPPRPLGTLPPPGMSPPPGMLPPPGTLAPGQPARAARATAAAARNNREFMRMIRLLSLPERGIKNTAEVGSSEPKNSCHPREGALCPARARARPQDVQAVLAPRGRDIAGIGQRAGEREDHAGGAASAAAPG